MSSFQRQLAITAFIGALLWATNASARPITLAWDANPNPSVTGYRISWGTTPRNYSDSLDIGNLISYQLDLPGDEYYFAVQAYIDDGTQRILSPFSLEVADTPAFWLTNPGNQFNRAGDIVTLQLVAHGSQLTYGAADLPTGLILDPATGLISGVVNPPTDTFNPSPVYVVTASATDAGGSISSVQFVWTVRVNIAPFITNPGNRSTFAGAAVTLAIDAWDLNDDVLTYSAVGLPAGLGIDAVSGLISGTVASDAAATSNVSVRASDGTLSTTTDFSWAVLSPDELAVDQVVSTNGFGSTVTTPPFSTAIAGETLIAFVTAAQPTDVGVQTASVTGGGLDWTLVARGNAQAGSAEIWQAAAPNVLSNISVSATVDIGGDTLSLTVVSFAGSDGAGATAVASAATGAPLVPLTTTAAGSFVYGAGNDWDAAFARTPALDQEIVHEYEAPTADTFWVQRYVGPVAAAGTVVPLNDTNPTIDRWNFAAVEIVQRGARRSITLRATANLPAPQPPGTGIALTAIATGGTAPYQFKWWVYTATGWTVLQDWNASADFTWTPAAPNALGTIEVWVRSAGSPADAPEKWVDLPYAILPALIVTADVAAPQSAGTRITLTAIAAGGTAAYEFKWWVYSATGWSVLQDWNAASSYAWTPATPNPVGAVEVWMRSAGSSADAPEQWADLPYVIQSVLTLTADLPAPQPPGRVITLTAITAGGTAPSEFKWWVYSATGWTVLQDWSTALSYVWTPVTPNPLGTIEVWMRSAGSSADSPEKWVDLPFAIQSALTVTADVAAPQPPGTSITLTAIAAGGTPPYQYKWWVYSATGWTVLQDWDAASSYVWTPMTPNPLAVIEVWMRSAGSSADAPENWVDLPYAIQSALTVTADVAAPQPPGTVVTLTATAGSGTSLFQYKWWVYSATGWTVLRDWDPSSTFRWTPATPNPLGTIEVWMRSAADATDAPERWADLAYVIQ